LEFLIIWHTIYTWDVKCNVIPQVNDKFLINPIDPPSGVSALSIYPNYILLTCLILSTLLFESFRIGAILILLKQDTVNK